MNWLFRSFSVLLADRQKGAKREGQDSGRSAPRDEVNN